MTQDISGELQVMQNRIAELQAMAVTTPTNLPVPSLSDNPNVPRDMLALATALENVTLPVFATTAARDAARTAGATFMMCFVGDTLYRWRAGAWMVSDPSRGRIAGTIQASTQDALAAGLVILSTNFTLTNGPRWIKITSSLTWQNVSTASPANVGTIRLNGSDLLRFVVGATTLNESYVRMGVAYVQAPVGANTAAVYAQANAGAMRLSTGAGTSLTVEDIGP